MSKGFVKAYRSVFEPMLADATHPLSEVEACLDLLLIANHSGAWRTVRGKDIQLKPGEVIASIRYLAERWRWSKDTVNRFLKRQAVRQHLRREMRQGESIIILEGIRVGDSLDPPECDSDKDSQQDAGATEARQRRRRERGKEDTPLPPEQSLLSLNSSKAPDENKPVKPPVTLESAKAYARSIKATPEEAEFWWRFRNAAGWRKGGQAAPKIISPWDDFATSLNGWVRKMMQEQTTSKRRNPNDPRPV